MKWIGPKELYAKVTQNLGCVYAEDSLAKKWVELVRKQQGDEVARNVEIKDVDAATCDAGGMIRMNEKETVVAAGNEKLKLYIRQAEMLADALEHAKPLGDGDPMPPFIVIQGHWTSLLVRPETRDEFVRQLKAIVAEKAGEIETEEKKIAAAKEAAFKKGVLIPEHEAKMRERKN